MSDLLILYNHCLIVKGAIRSAICDLQRKNLHFIPNALSNLFIDGRYLDIPEIKGHLDLDDQEIFREYVAFLEDHELIFTGGKDDLSCFPALSMEWKFPGHITHCILDGERTLPFFDQSFLKQLETLCCNFIQIRFFSDVSFEELNRLLSLIRNAQIKSVEIILPMQNDDSFFVPKMEGLVIRNGKIALLTITGSTETKIYRQSEDGAGGIILSGHRISGHSHCGIVHTNLFAINLPHYSESLHHNTCLNRKISIDVGGNIKNCPSMQESFGNINDTTLIEAINKPGFKKYWNITKDEITKCKDCEFRHVCTDCRAYLEHPDDIYSAPLKCGYDPYTCTWEDWSVNPLKQTAMEYYKINELK